MGNGNENERPGPKPGYGSRIRELIQRSEPSSYRAIAEEIGVSARAIENWVAEKDGIKWTRARALAAFFTAHADVKRPVDPEWIWSAEGPTPWAIAPDAAFLEGRVAELESALSEALARSAAFEKESRSRMAAMKVQLANVSRRLRPQESQPSPSRRQSRSQPG